MYNMEILVKLYFCGSHNKERYANNWTSSTRKMLAFRMEFEAESDFTVSIGWIDCWEKNYSEAAEHLLSADSE
jgi:hypothetical protein